MYSEVTHTSCPLFLFTVPWACYSNFTEAEALEASIMAAMPHEIAEHVYDQLEAIGCRCPAGCELVFPIEELERVRICL